MASVLTKHNMSFTPQQILEKSKSARGWYLAIIVFSVINSLLIVFHANMTFVIGLGVTQFIDAVFSLARTGQNSGVSTVIALIGFVINLFPIGIFFLIWWLSSKGNAIAYAVGMGLYLLDGLLFLLVQDWVGLAFHAYFLFMLWAGYPFVKAHRQAEMALAQIDQPAPDAPPAEAI